MQEVKTAELTQLLHEWREGDQQALHRLVPLIYPELKRIAHAHLKREFGHKPLSTTELVSELYLRLATGNSPEWDSRTHFYSIAARLTRQILVDSAREQRAQKRGSGVQPVSLEEAKELAGGRSPDVLAIHEALSQLAQFDERKAQILELRYFGGLEAAQISAVLDLSESTIAREIRAAKAWLRSYLAQ
ncbi:ECF-type sigma factor [Paludibaculum fermentans]|uniref:Sigma-70 family RNA polymerase sigma factor n=1 Tax=Paludibaculum fermentans TaxID=1473598 RepID=A0A7S7SM25_PALFE|nr:ECF-type sigma factor [Paludibaculum fermentans]QOY89061.1 sigma-70 family RNA polymerase sigma factor [Paludibaculum fermentans]